MFKYWRIEISRCSSKDLDIERLTSWGLEKDIQRVAKDILQAETDTTLVAQCSCLGRLACYSRTEGEDPLAEYRPQEDKSLAVQPRSMLRRSRA